MVPAASIRVQDLTAENDRLGLYRGAFLGSHEEMSDATRPKH
jgi:hypothetical protein